MVEHCGSVTGAARALHLTPSAVSQQLRALSRELGVELLTPVGRGVKLTPVAHLTLTHTHRLYEQWETASAEIRAHAGEAPIRIRVCGFASALATLAVPTVTQLISDDPPVHVHFREAETPDSFELLLTEQADVALIVPNAQSPSADDPRFDQRPLLYDVMDLLVPADHHLAARTEVNLADAARDRWISAVPEQTEQHTQLLAACSAAGFRPHIAHYATELSVVIEMVADGLGVKLLPRLVTLPADPRLVRVPLSGQPRPVRRIIIATRRGSHDQPRLEHTIRALHQVAEARLTDQ